MRHVKKNHRGVRITNSVSGDVYLDCFFEVAQFNGVIFKDVTFQGCVFSHARLVRAEFVNCSFIDCNMRHVRGDGESFFTGCSFYRTNRTGLTGILTRSE